MWERAMWDRAMPATPLVAGVVFVAGMARSYGAGACSSRLISSGCSSV